MRIPYLLSCFLILTFLFPHQPLAQYPAPDFPDYYPEFNNFYSEKPLGVSFEHNMAVFRLFAPRATKVSLEIYTKHDADSSITLPMKVDSNGVWESFVPGIKSGLYYGYRVAGPDRPGEMFDSTVVIADPYAKAVVTKNNYHHPAKALVWNEPFDWEGDTWNTTPIEDLIVYEMHVRDMTAHPSSGVEKSGMYSGLTETNRSGGLDYIKSLGVNAVELLPVQDFANIELPYNSDETAVRNTWNPYARNHWGYMTSYFFAPESYYASDGTMEPDAYCGAYGQQVNELKTVVKTMHDNGIAVIMDVVYNHVSQYDYNPLKYIDKKYYFRLDSSDQFLSYSGCGNDLMTERPMTRRLIIESVKYWMTEYHIDGFRFDLATLIDEETCKQILQEARAINPNVYLIAEAWGGGYDPIGFSEIGWAAWNDKIRNGVKGQNPYDNLGFIFANWEGENSPESMRRYVTGTLIEEGGLFQSYTHSINYLASHDDHTIGDFIRIGLGDVEQHAIITNIDSTVRLTTEQLDLHKLAAVFLLTTQGPVMLHAGQEYARSKIIAETDVPDTLQGTIDHNSYNKDNATNYLNYHHAMMNQQLIDYYRGLIELRKAYPLFRSAGRENIRFLDQPDPFGLGYHITGQYGSQAVVLLNANPDKSLRFTLPTGKWSLTVDGIQAGVYAIERGIQDEVKVSSRTGLVLIAL